MLLCSCAADLTCLLRSLRLPIFPLSTAMVILNIKFGHPRSFARCCFCLLVRTSQMHMHSTRDHKNMSDTSADDDRWIYCNALVKVNACPSYMHIRAHQEWSQTFLIEPWKCFWLISISYNRHHFTQYFFFPWVKLWASTQTSLQTKFPFNHLNLINMSLKSIRVKEGSLMWLITRNNEAKNCRGRCFFSESSNCWSCLIPLQ